MTSKSIYNILKGKSYYNGMSALGIHGLRIFAISDDKIVKSITVGNDKSIWVIYYCKGFRSKDVWTVGDEFVR